MYQQREIKILKKISPRFEKKRLFVNIKFSHHDKNSKYFFVFVLNLAKTEVKNKFNIDKNVTLVKFNNTFL